MPLTVVVTRNVESRYRGFLTSVMLEVSAGVYVAPNMSHGVRDRTWSVISDWWSTLGQGSLTLIWRDTTRVGELNIQTLGEPPKEIVDADGILLVKRKLTTDTSPARTLTVEYDPLLTPKRLPRTRGDRPIWGASMGGRILAPPHPRG